MILDNYLNHLNEGRIDFLKKHNILIEKLIKTKKEIWLYHGTSIKYFPEIKEKGLITSRQGTGHNIGFIYYHPSNKPSLSYTSFKGYAKSYSLGKRVFGKPDPLLVLVQTKDLFQMDKAKLLKADEYLSPYDIPPDKVIFPDNLKYKEIEESHIHLVRGFSEFSL